MKTVLIVTYYWPPSGGPGVQRILKFCRYLSDFGWKPIVITVKDGSYPSLDPSLAQDIPVDLQVIKTDAFEPFRLYNMLRGQKGKAVPVAVAASKESKSMFQRLSMYIRANFFIPDARKGWRPYAFKAAQEVLRKQQVDAVLTTGPPHSTHLVGLGLQQQHNLPWIADLRDPWVNIYYNQFLPRNSRSLAKDQRLENTVAQSANALMVVSPGLKAEFNDRARQVEVIYNGFDPHDLSGEVEPDQVFSLAYIGNFKGNQDVPALWEVLAELLAENEAFKQAFRLKVTGKLDPGVEASIADAGLQQHLDLQGFVPHQEATRQMRQAQFLLFVVPISKHNRLILTGKLFEYLACGTPMLSIGPKDGNAAQIISETGRLPMEDYADRESLKVAIQTQFDTWKANNRQLPKHPLTAAVKKYSRQEQAGALADLLNRVVDEKNKHEESKS